VWWLARNGYLTCDQGLLQPVQGVTVTEHVMPVSHSLVLTSLFYLMFCVCRMVRCASCSSVRCRSRV